MRMLLSRFYAEECRGCAIAEYNERLRLLSLRAGDLLEF